MGGTSTDVCLIAGGRADASDRARRSAACRSGCRPSTCTPSAPAAARSSGATRAARCASAPRVRAPIPGPACYGRGRRAGDGHRREPAARTAAGRSSRAASSSTATRQSARSTGSTLRRSSTSSTPRCCVRCASCRSSAATIPPTFALVAYGGAGPLHACELADELGMRDGARPRSRGRPLRARACRVGGTTRRGAVVSRAARGSGGATRREGEADLRYAGQSFELTVPLQADLAAAFHRAHEEQYGFAEPERELELVAVRTAEIRPGPELELAPRRGNDASPARCPSSSRAPPAGFPPGGWGLGMVARCD